MVTPKCLDTFDTEFSADSVEWCPIEPFRDVFVCGTYELSKADESNDSGKCGSAKRLGRIYLFRVIENGKLNLLQQLDVPAVLDIKWKHTKANGKILLGVVNSIGRLGVYELFHESDLRLILITEKNIAGESENDLALSLDWCFEKNSDENDSNDIVVSDSAGCVSVLKLGDSVLEVETTWNGHDYEAWIAEFDYWNSNVLYSGGDDCKFQWYDRRMGSKAGMNKIHGAGVTSLHSNLAREFLLASGSYDETLRLWDTRQLRVAMSEVNLGGGIWRLKWDPFVHKYLLAACMYGGFKIVDSDDVKELDIIAEYMEHESIAYGCDWSHLSSGEIKLQREIDETEKRSVLIGTCSFYDHTLKLSSFHLNKLH